jgi:hypothetical protein
VSHPAAPDPAVALDRSVVSDRLRDRWLEEPAPSRLALDRPDRPQILATHAAAVQAGASSYQDPTTGLQVMTAVSLAERGRCCGSGCRHCPFVDAER